MNTYVPRILKEKLWENKPKQLPSPPAFSTLIGPGVIMLATAFGSGEIYFWPGITMKYGFSLIWLAIIAIYIQYILNTEFARYTITTGETIITGFTRLWKPLGWVFLACSTLPWIWPGWSKGGAEAFTWVFGGDANIIAFISLLLIGVTLTTSKIVYKALEGMQKILIIGVLVCIIIVAVYVVNLDSLTALGSGMKKFPQLPTDINLSTLLAALAFCGAGGSINLATSNWIRDKGFGMGAYIPKITSPITGEPISHNDSGFFPKMNTSDVQNWKKWWALINKEQFFTFFVTGLVGLILLMLISHSLLYGLNIEIGMNMLKIEGEKIAENVPYVTNNIFYLVVAAIFFTSAIGVLDHVSRIVADIMSSYFHRHKGILSNESKLYFFVLWAMIAIGSIILLFFDNNQPQKLLAIAGSLSGIVMFLYSILVLILNIRIASEIKKEQMPFNPFHMTVWRKIIVIIGILFYGFFSASLIVNLF